MRSLEDALRESAESGFGAHGPVLDSRHPCYRIVDIGVGNAAESDVQLIQPFPQPVEKIHPPRVFVLEGQAQALDRLAAPDVQPLLSRHLEQLFLCPGVPEESVSPIGRIVTRHLSYPRRPPGSLRSFDGP